jgi:hypothetical protein
LIGSECNPAFILFALEAGMMEAGFNFAAERKLAPSGWLELEVCLELEMRSHERGCALGGLCRGYDAQRRP